MKHLFFVNSHTSFLSSVGTVNYLQLHADDVVFFAARHYKNSLLEVDWSIFDISDVFAQYTDHEIWRNRTIRQIFQKNMDNLIKTYIHDQYKLYCSHYAHPGIQMLYTNPNCVEGSYVQEGGVPFKTTFVTKVPFGKKMVYWLVNNIYLRTKRCHYPVVWYYPGFLNKQEKVHSYAISDSFFKYLPSINHIIKWPVKNVDIEIPQNSTIFIFDGFVYHGLCEKEFYLQCCNRLIIEEKSENNLLRFHPAQSEDEKKRIISYFKGNGLAFEIMDSSIPFEWILISSSQKFKVTGFGSSLLFFSKDYGHDVVCRDEWLSSSKKYQKYKKENGFLFFRESYCTD